MDFHPLKDGVIFQSQGYDFIRFAILCTSHGLRPVF